MEKGSAMVVLVILVLVLSAILVFVAWFPNPSAVSYISPTPAQVQSVVPSASSTPSADIKNTADLDAASKSLDGSDLNQFDTELNNLSSDSSSF